MGLRLTEGISLTRFKTRTGQTMAESVDAGILTQCIAAGYLTLTHDQLAATQEGRIRLNALLSALVV